MTMNGPPPDDRNPPDQLGGATDSQRAVVIGLTAVIFAMDGHRALTLTTHGHGSSTQDWPSQDWPSQDWPTQDWQPQQGLQRLPDHATQPRPDHTADPNARLIPPEVACQEGTQSPPIHNRGTPTPGASLTAGPGKPGQEDPDQRPVATPADIAGHAQPPALSALPFGPFNPVEHRTFELAVRAFVKQQTGFELGFVEQLYTFGDRGREVPAAPISPANLASMARLISVGYLGLAPSARQTPTGVWADWYVFFPWEDWRRGRPAIIGDTLVPALNGWADAAEGEGRRKARRARAQDVFGLDGAPWNEERVLDRYELLYEAGLVFEAQRGVSPLSTDAERPTNIPSSGTPLVSDHRRILATAVQRLRGKIKYRPVVFELLGETFTLSTLQTVTETILGVRLHKQNFRRALLSSALVEGTGVLEPATGGRPAELYRYRPDAAIGRPALGIPAPRLSG